ncbi:MAG: hypothetical protein Q7S51_08290, partial [Gallionellaceae bacterium]|nr:hypothetical protein [Gallionellaceae bacterium]
VTITYLSYSFYTDTHSPVQQNVLIFLIEYLVFALLLARNVFRSDQPSSKRKLWAMVADLGAITFVMSATQEISALFFGLYLWVVIGNGIRYGTQSLIRGQLLSAFGFSLVITLNNYWSTHLSLAAGLLLTLILIPLYIFGLFQRMSMARKIADAASYLDFLKRSHDQRIITEARQHVENLHTIAGYLAGDQVGKLYLVEDPPE